MAYSDYGGYAFKDGELRTDHCDVVIYKEKSEDPSKRYPNFFGGDRDEELPRAHVSLGNSDMRVMLYKQSWLEIWHKGKQLNLFEILTLESKREVTQFETTYTDDDGKPYFNHDAFLEAGRPAVFEHEGFKVEVFFEETDNYYIYARLTQPDGCVWTGFSGYGVGNGLEDSDMHPFDTDSNVLRLRELFAPKEHQGDES